MSSGKDNTAKDLVKKLTDGVTKDLPKLVKENKGAAAGAVIGYLLSDKLNDNEGLITGIVGALVGHAVDNKKEKF